MFRISAPHAKKVQVIVCLVQDDAKPTTHMLRKGIDSVWSLRMELPRGRYVYRFLVDDVPTLDPKAQLNVTDEHAGDWSMREIGH